MYIPYFELSKTAALFAPVKLREAIRDWGYGRKVCQNLCYIKKNYFRVLKKLKRDVKVRKLVVAFHVYDQAKWKCQSLYDLMLDSNIFEPYIFVTKNCAPAENFNFQKESELEKVYNFFKVRKMRVQYAYKNDKFIPFEDMKPKPDIIIYQHPWYVETSQGPVVSSRFALTCYVPYFVATSEIDTEYCLRFHQYVENYYVLNDLIKKYYSANMTNNGINLKVTGHPMLDYFYLNKDRKYDSKNMIIYAPHWTVDSDNTLQWGTFLWNGMFILDYAKSHPEFDWVFKPHPCLANYLRTKKHMTKSQIDDYWNEWAKIGIVCETGDYLDLFMESKAMITDCGSFETEYFMTKKPLIHLNSKNATPYNPSVKKIVENYYCVNNIQELSNALDNVIIRGNDSLKASRDKLYDELGYDNNYAAFNIIKDLETALL